jgi:pyridoxine kinase
MVAAIRDTLVPLADAMTPNRHEVGWLAGRGVDSNAAIVDAVRALDLREAVVTSAHGSPAEAGTLVVAQGAIQILTHRRLADVPHGTGDLFAALYLGHRLDGEPPLDAAQHATSAVLRLIEIAADTNADEMPLAAGQDAFRAPAQGVTVGRL